MRETHKTQPKLIEPWLDLPHAKELKAISDLLDQHPILGALVAQDISRGKSKRTGGLTGDQVPRLLIVKQMNGFTYDALRCQVCSSVVVAETQSVSTASETSPIPEGTGRWGLLCLSYPADCGENQ